MTSRQNYEEMLNLQKDITGQLITRLPSGIENVIYLIDQLNDIYSKVSGNEKNQTILQIAIDIIKNHKDNAARGSL